MPVAKIGVEIGITAELEVDGIAAAATDHESCR
jgi:hypothetical protein